MPFHQIRRFARALAMLLSALVMPTSAGAQDADPWLGRLEARAADVIAVLGGEKPREEVFTEAFNAQVSEEMLHAMHRQTEAQMGPLVGVESVAPGPQPGSATIALRFEQAIVSGPMQLELAEPYRVAGLLLSQVDPIADTETPVLDQLRALPGTASLLLARLDGSHTLLEHNADTPLAIGSTFKLYVLSALVQEIAAGRRAWDEVVPLAVHSFPSGMLQDWPLGTPLTLQSLATLMIAISDNTATDQLIATLGREAVEAELVASGHSAPELALPLMTTREMFVLKSVADDVNLGEYASLGTPERLAVLKALQEREVALDRVIGAFGGAPRAIEVEWFASARDIARILERIRDDPVARGILAINPALDEEATAGWNYVGYKGGSEPGVLNLSWLLRDAAGAWYVLTLGWNHPDEAIPTMRLLALARSALNTLDPTGG